jgi:hypothetical protein
MSTRWLDRRGQRLQLGGDAAVLLDVHALAAEGPPPSAV